MTEKLGAQKGNCGSGLVVPPRAAVGVKSWEPQKETLRGPPLAGAMMVKASRAGHGSAVNECSGPVIGRGYRGFVKPSIDRVPKERWAEELQKGLANVQSSLGRDGW